MRELLAAFVLIFLPGQLPLSNLRAQTQSPQPNGDKTAAKPSKIIPLDPSLKHLSVRAANILRATADDAKGWKDARVAAEVQSQIADLIWDVDPLEAQIYLERAWATTSRVEEKTQERSSFRNQSARNDARREVMLVARKRVPELAQKWLEQMAQEAEAEQSGEPRGVFDDRTTRSTVLLQMAMQTAAENPKAAAELAMESLRDGISFGLQQVLIKIQEKDFDLAQAVLRAALTRLKTVGMLDPNELLILYAYLYTPGRIYAANTSDNRGSSQLALTRNQVQVTAAARLNPELALEFLRLATDLLINAPLPITTGDPQSAARSQLSAINYLITEVSRQLPEQAIALQRRVQQIEIDARFSTIPSPPRPDTPTPLAGESRKDYEERQVDVLEEIAKKETNPLGRDIAYAKAALATTVERYERGLNLAEKIQDKPLREGVLDWLLYRASLYFLKADNFDKAYALAIKNDGLAQRAACLVVGAQRLVKAKDTIRASLWLQEARALMKKAEPDENWSRIAFGVAYTYGQFDNLIALESLSEAVKLSEKSPASLKDDENAPLIKRFSGLAALPDFTYGTTGFGLKAAVSIFTPDLFESVLYILNNIASPEARGMAVVTLCRKYIQPKSKSPAKHPDTPDGAPSLRSSTRKPMLRQSAAAHRIGRF